MPVPVIVGPAKRRVMRHHSRIGVKFMRLPRYVLFPLLFLLLAVQAHAADVVVIQSSSLKVYAPAREAFLAELLAPNPTAGPKHIVPLETETLLLSDFSDTDAARAAVQHLSPRLLFTLGEAALEFAAGLPSDIPIVFALAADPSKVTVPNRQITGISLDIAPGRQLDLFLSTFSFKRPGIIYSEDKTAALVKKAEQAAIKHGLQPVVRQVNHVKEAPGMLKSMADKIDALWLMPDSTVLTPSTMEYLAYFSLKYKIPVFGFSQNLFRYGETAAAVFDVGDIGRQAALLADRILKGAAAASLAIEAPAKAQLVINETVANNLGLRDVRPMARRLPGDVR